MSRLRAATLLMLAGALAGFWVPASSAADLTADEILLKADEVRNPQMDYTVQVTVTSVKPKAAPRAASYDVWVKGRERAVVKTVAPAIERGRLLLMRDGDLWAFLPTVSKPLRISLRERLIGDVANGDLARANFFGDYAPALLREESTGDAQCYVLELTARSAGVTYGKVLLWVERETFHPHHAEFFAISGRKLKSCAYGRYQHTAGRLRPTRLVMTDALAVGQQSVLEYEAMKITPLPEKYFTKDYMKKLME